MTTALLIPARFASTRFPGKPLAPLVGATGVSKTLIHRTWEAACAVPGIDHRYVVTDDTRIVEEAARIGAPVLMTSPEARNGTERCAEAAAMLAQPLEIIVNLQGDAPLTPPGFVTALIAAMRANPDCAVATPVLRCDRDSLARFRADNKAGRAGATTAVFDAGGRALYFSKAVVPFLPDDPAPGAEVPVFHHVGVYAYRPSALAVYVSTPPGRLETIEGLEQLRFLEAGISVTCVEVAAPDAVFWELNTPEDTQRIEAALMASGRI